MRVLFAARSYQGAGRRTYLQRLLPRLASNGFEPTVVTDGPGPLPEELRRLGGRVVVLENFERAAGEQELRALLRQGQFDLAQSNGYNAALALACQKEAIAHVWRVGASPLQGLVDFDQTRERSLAACMAGLSRRIVCPSNFIAAPLRAVAPDQVTVIPNGVDPGPEPLRAAGEGDRFTVAMVAHLLPQKRHEDFILAARHVLRELPSTSFVVFGEAYSTKLSTQYIHRVQELAGADVRFEHFRDSPRRHLEEVDVMVLPSIEEGASNAIIEAMAAARPVVASRSGGNPEIVLHEQTGLLVEPCRPEELAQALVRLLRSPAAMGRMGAAGRRRASQDFSLCNLDLYPKLYWELLG